MSGVPTCTGPYAQSFLKDEMGKMYRGEPGAFGCTRKSIRSTSSCSRSRERHDGSHRSRHREFNPSTRKWAISRIVKPKAVVLVNEAMTAGLGVAISAFFSSCVDETKSAA